MNASSPATTLQPPRDKLRLTTELFLLSFLALFLELLLIRWVPSAVRLVAYFANLMLISSFLGLGAGALASSRKLALFRFFPLILLCDIAFILLCQEVLVPGSAEEVRFFQGEATVAGYLVLIGIFCCNVALFVPVGERIGQLFNALPPLQAYSWDLGGSLAGTLVFGVFSLLAFSPLWGLAAVSAIFILLAERRLRGLSAVCLAGAVASVLLVVDPRAFWSPYYYVTVHDEQNAVQDQQTAIVDVSQVSNRLRTIADPPIYSVHVNHDFYQPHGTIHVDRYSPDSKGRELAADMFAEYSLPYILKPNPPRVAVVGAGGGTDVEAALLNGAGHVVAVEIDPTLVRLSRRINASGVYDDPKVEICVEDARAFLQQTDQEFDLIVFGYLDSQALFSSMSNIRLDGYVYTVESIRTAFQRLRADGALVLTFYVGDKQWLTDKLLRMMKTATGALPTSYTDGQSLMMLSLKDTRVRTPKRIGKFQLLVREPSDVAVPTDDWPYLYLTERTIPSDYVVVIAVLAILSLLGLRVLTPNRMGSNEWHFFFLGLGFLLLQTRSIVSCSLYFGTTWLITTVIVCGVLLMVFLANFVVQTRLSRFSRWLYLPLMASLTTIYLVPSELILSLPYGGRLAWTLLVVPLPIFFAGLVFSTTFRLSARPSAAFGANLIGATLGGFLEYAGMALGHLTLGWFVIAAYLASLVLVARPSK